MTNPIKRQLRKKNCSIEKVGEIYQVTPPETKGLVLSGGGAKGIAYSGMIKAMEKNDFLKALTHVSGASAGSITACMLSIGMETKDIQRIQEGIDLKKLIDRSGLSLRGEGERLRNVVELLTVFQLKQLLGRVEPKEQQADYETLQTKLKASEDILNKQGILLNSFDDIMDVVTSIENLKKLDLAYKEIPKNSLQGQNSRVTFNDLNKLRSILPEEEQYLIKNLSVVNTNTTTKALEVFNENLTPDASVAEKVKRSCAHPILFSPEKNERGEYISDGGILDNMPAEVLTQAGLTLEEILCVKLETDKTIDQRMEKAKDVATEKVGGIGKVIDSVADRLLIGGRFKTAVAELYNREKVFHNLNNMLYLSSGSIGTTTSHFTEEQKQHALQQSEAQTETLLNSRIQSFTNPFIAMLYLGKDLLDRTIIDSSCEQELAESARHAKMVFNLQKNIIKCIQEPNTKTMPLWLDTLSIAVKDATNSDKEFEASLSLCLKQINFKTEGKLESYLVKSIQEAKNPAELSFFSKFKNLLTKPFEWIAAIVFPTKDSTQKETNVHRLETGKIEAYQQKMSSLKDRLSLLKSQDMKEVKAIEKTKDDTAEVRQLVVS